MITISWRADWAQLVAWAVPEKPEDLKPVYGLAVKRDDGNQSPVRRATRGDACGPCTPETAPPGRDPLPRGKEIVAFVQSSWSGSNASVTSNERSFKLVRERFADEGTVTPARDGAFRCR